MKPAGTLHFSHYEQVIHAAIEGEGVALGHKPLVKVLFRKRLLIAPFAGKTASSRQYFMVVSPGAQQHAEVAALRLLARVRGYCPVGAPCYRRFWPAILTTSLTVTGH